MNLTTGAQTKFEREGGIYVLDLWVNNDGQVPASGFPRPGR